MYCNYCGQGIQDNAAFCAYCGRRVGGTPTLRRLFRAREGKKLAGVCQGFAEFLEMDVSLVRVIALLLAIFAFPLAEIAYVAAWIVMPEVPLQLPAPARSYPATEAMDPQI